MTTKTLQTGWWTSLLLRTTDGWGGGGDLQAGVPQGPPVCGPERWLPLVPIQPHTYSPSMPSLSLGEHFW